MKLWQKFWFQEQSAKPIALFRIFFGLLVLQVTLMELLPNFMRLCSVRGLISTSTVYVYWWQRVPVFDIFLLLPQQDIFRWCFFCLFIISAIFLTFGFSTRLSAIFVYLGLLSLDRELPFFTDGGDDCMRIMGFLLIFSAAGKAYSLDRVMQARKEGCRLSELAPVLVSPWAQRMIQVQISLAYFDAFMAKIVGHQWQDGTAVYYASHLADFAKFQLPLLTNYYPVYKILTYYTLFIELAMATLVWIKPLRYWILFAAASLHIGIDLTMNLPGFEWMFICTYITFIEPADLEKILQRGQTIIFKPFQRTLSPQADIQSLKPKITQSYSFLPIFSFLLIILLLGSLSAIPLRQRFIIKEHRRDYQLRLAKTENLWTDRLHQIASMPNSPANKEEKLTGQEALAVILSLQKRYDQAGSLLRSLCAKRIQENKPYNPELVRAFSTMANIYLETGHLDACELCYRTILDYEKAHLPPNAYGDRIATDLNNLGVTFYFRALLDKNRAEQLSNFLKSDTFFRQSLNKLHNSKRQSEGYFNLDEADILSNRYLSLRELGYLKEAKTVKAEAAILGSARTKVSLP